MRWLLATGTDEGRTALLGRDVLRRFAWPAGCIALSALAWVVFVRPVDPVDFRVFVAGGRAVAQGLDPYPHLGTPEVWSGSAYVYPWLTAWLFAPTASLSAHSAVLLMQFLSFAALAAGVWCIAGARLGVFACVLFSAPTLDGVQVGTLNAFLFLGVCLAWRWRDRAPLVGSVIGVLVMLKLVCWPLALWLLCTRRWRAAASSVAVGGALLGAGWLLGPLSLLSYGRMLAQLSSHEVQASSGLQGALVRAGLPATGAQVVGLAIAVALIVRAARRSDALGYGAAVVAALMASPVVWHHYYLLAAAPLLLFGSGPVLYLLLGWMSLTARSAYGISWQVLTVVAFAAAGVLVGRTLWRRREALRGLLCRAGAPSLGVGLVALAALFATRDVGPAGIGRLLLAFGPTLVSLAGCVLVLMVAWRRTRPAGDGR